MCKCVCLHLYVSLMRFLWLFFCCLFLSYAVLVACLFSNEKKKGGYGFVWVGGGEDLGGVKGGNQDVV